MNWDALRRNALVNARSALKIELEGAVENALIFALDCFYKFYN